MRVTRTTVTAHIPKKNFKYIDDQLALIFNSLRDILKPYEKKLDVRVNLAHYYELWTNRGYRSKSSPPKNKKGIAFVSIIIFKKHVAFYFLPLSNMTLRSNIKPELKHFLHGRYTFHFDILEPIVERQIVEMVHDGWLCYEKEGLVYP